MRCGDFAVCNTCCFLLQILIDTAQKRQALGEIEARHQEILHLEENIKVDMETVL